MGKKWMWKFSYPDGPNAIGTLHVPANRPVRLLMTSRDVIHSFYVPDFRIKQDVLPGPLHRDLVRGDQARPLPDPVRRVLRHLALADVGRGRGHAGAGVRQLAGRAEGAASPNASTPAATTAASFRGTIVEYGKQIAMAQGCVKCHSLDGEPHIGPTWLDLYTGARRWRTARRSSPTRPT